MDKIIIAKIIFYYICQKLKYNEKSLKIIKVFAIINYKDVIK